MFPFCSILPSVLVFSQIYYFHCPWQSSFPACTNCPSAPQLSVSQHGSFLCCVPSVPAGGTNGTAEKVSVVLVFLVQDIGVPRTWKEQLQGKPCWPLAALGLEEAVGIVWAYSTLSATGMQLCGTPFRKNEFSNFTLQSASNKKVCSICANS